jgi:hypothetical protein
MNQIKKQCKRQNSEKEIATLRKTRSAVYRSLDDFLRKIPIAASNQFGQLVIRGTRIA